MKSTIVARRSVGLWIACFGLAVGLLVPMAPGAMAQDFGDPTGSTPNARYGCEAGPRLFNSNGDYAIFPSGAPTCTWWQLPTFPRGPNGTAPRSGRVTAVKVRSGPNPAPLRFTVVRTIVGRDANGGVPSQGAAACCFGQKMTRTFRLRPNRVTTIPLNLPVKNSYDRINNADLIDAVGFSATSNTGDIPVRATSNPPNSSQFATRGNPSVGMLYPQITPGQVRTQSTSAPSHIITARFTMCTAGTRGRRARTAPMAARTGGSACGARVKTGQVSARKGKIRLPLSSVGAAKGKIVVRKASGRRKLGKTKRFFMGPRGKSRIAVKLTRAGKRATAGKRSVRAKVIIRSQGTNTVRKIRIK